MKPAAQCSYLNPQSEVQVTHQIAESLPSGPEGKRAISAVTSSTRHLRYIAMSLLALFLAGSSFAQAPKLLYYGVEAPSLGPVVGTAVATTGSTGTCCRSPYIVVATNNPVAESGDPLQLQFWNDTGSKLVYVTSATWNPAPGGCTSYTLGTLDSSKVVAACIDSFNSLHLSVWRVAGASASDFYEMGEQSVASSGYGNFGYFGVSVTALSPTEVVTAATDPSHDLRVQTWNIAITGSPTEPFATVTQQHTAVGGGIVFPFAVAINGTQVVTATDSETCCTRKVIAWSVDSSGDITRQGDLQVGSNGTSTMSGIALAPLGGFLGGGYEVMTVAQNNPDATDNFSTRVTSWDISSAGVVSGGNSGSGTEQNVYSSSVGIAWTPGLYPFTVSLTTSDSSVMGGRIEQWQYSSPTWSVLHGTGVGGNHPNPPYGAAVAGAGSDSTLIYYVVTFTGKDGDVNIQLWSAPA
jgi:hypothetical protein